MESRHVEGKVRPVEVGGVVLSGMRGGLIDGTA